MKNEYDPLDYAAQRDEAIRFLEVMKETVDKTLQYQRLTEDDRKTLSIVKDKLYVFEELDKHFIAPHAASKPATASHGYEMLCSLMQASFYAGSRATVTESAFRYVDKQAQSSRGSSGGLISGKTNQEKQAKKWANQALQIAKDYVASNEGYSQDDLATHIKYMLDDLAPGHRQIKNVVASWQNKNKISKPIRKRSGLT